MGEVTVGMVAITISLLAQLILQILTWLETSRVSGLARKDAICAQEAAGKAAAQVLQVKEKLQHTDSVMNRKMDATLDTLNVVHTLTNSGMTAQLRITMVALQRIADVTHDPEDIAAAQLASKMYQDHEARQAKADQQERDQAKAQQEILKQREEA